MKDERIREIALVQADYMEAGYKFCGREEMADYVAAGIRLALAERDREIATWARLHSMTIAFEEGTIALTDLLAFLEAQP